MGSKIAFMKRLGTVVVSLLYIYVIENILHELIHHTVLLSQNLLIIYIHPWIAHFTHDVSP
jgi:hypothetical protein